MRSLLRLLVLAALVLAGTAHAQPAAAPPGKLALASLTGDVLAVTVRREATGTNVQSNPVSLIKMPGPIFDLTLLKAVQAAAERARPQWQVAMLRVPAPGSSGDPTLVVVDGKVAAAHPLVEALRQQGFTHLLTATKLRTRNAVKLAGDQVVGTGQLEGLGFYIDYSIKVERVGAAESAQGIIAPHMYVQLTLIDLASMAVLDTRRITSNGVAAASRNPEGTDPWGAMSAEEKMRAITRLIDMQTGPAVAELLPAQ